MRGILLYGPPASGKDTVTESLSRLDSTIQIFSRLKVGGGKSGTYRVIDQDALDRLRESGEIIWENSRYGATYAIDRPELRARLVRGIPVVHLGQEQAIAALRSSVPEARWLTVSLWCPRDTASVRLAARNPHDVAERLAVWDATASLPGADLVIDTDAASPIMAANQIMAALSAQAASEP